MKLFKHPLSPRASFSFFKLTTGDRTVLPRFWLTCHAGCACHTSLAQATSPSASIVLDLKQPIRQHRGDIDHILDS